MRLQGIGISNIDVLNLIKEYSGHDVTTKEGAKAFINMSEMDRGFIKKGKGNDRKKFKPKP